MKVNSETQSRVVSEVEKTFLAAKKANPKLNEQAFLYGAMAAFLAIYGVDDAGNHPLAPPKWVLAGMRGKSIFAK
jgi:hypothetical protein